MLHVADERLDSILTDMEVNPKVDSKGKGYGKPVIDEDGLPVLGSLIETYLRVTRLQTHIFYVSCI